MVDTGASPHQTERKLCVMVTERSTKVNHTYSPYLHTLHVNKRA